MDEYKEVWTMTTYVRDVFRLRSMMDSGIDSLAEVGQILYYECDNGVVEGEILDRIVRLLADVADNETGEDSENYNQGYAAGWNDAIDDAAGAVEVLRK
jgi:hypothetical protein